MAKFWQVIRWIIIVIGVIEILGNLASILLGDTSHILSLLFWIPVVTSMVILERNYKGKNQPNKKRKV